jgi:hypothetical protein
LRVTLNHTSYNQQRLKLEIDHNHNQLNLIHQVDGVISYYNFDELYKIINNKLSHNVTYVLAENKIINKTEYFHYDEAYSLSNLDLGNFLNSIKLGYIVIDFRMYFSSDKAVRDHGVAFRIKSDYFDRIFNNKTRIL